MPASMKAPQYCYRVRPVERGDTGIEFRAIVLDVDFANPVAGGRDFGHGRLRCTSMKTHVEHQCVSRRLQAGIQGRDKIGTGPVGNLK